MIYDHDSMKIDDDTLVSIDVEMYDAQGNLLEKSDEPLTYLHGHGDIFSRIEEELWARKQAPTFRYTSNPKKRSATTTPSS